jgi:hypothetical protein
MLGIPQMLKNPTLLDTPYKQAHGEAYGIASRH